MHILPEPWASKPPQAANNDASNDDMPPPEYLSTVLLCMWNKARKQQPSLSRPITVPLVPKVLPAQRYKIPSKGPRQENSFSTNLPDRTTSVTPDTYKPDSVDESPGLTETFDVDEEDCNSSYSSAPSFGDGNEEVAIANSYAAKVDELEELIRNNWV
jgi:hypothetical protein